MLNDLRITTQRLGDQQKGTEEVRQKEEQKDYVDEVMAQFIAEKGREPESILEFLDFLYRREGTECDRTN